MLEVSSFKKGYSTVFPSSFWHSAICFLVWVTGRLQPSDTYDFRASCKKVSAFSGSPFLLMTHKNTDTQTITLLYKCIAQHQTDRSNAIENTDCGNYWNAKSIPVLRIHSTIKTMLVSYNDDLIDNSLKCREMWGFWGHYCWGVI